jgi:hypothetical protein
LAVRLLAELAAVLPLDADRERAPLRQRRVVDHQRRTRPAHQPVRPLGQHPPQRRVVPGRAGDEVLQLVMAGEAQARRHRLQTFALARAEQSAQIHRRPGPPLLVPERSKERRQPPIQVASGATEFGHCHLLQSRSGSR